MTLNRNTISNGESSSRGRNPLWVPYKWNTGVFDCQGDGPLCIETLFCWHAQLTAQYNKINYDAQGPMVCPCICFALCDIWLIGAPSVICIAVNRAGIRSRYRIGCEGEDCIKEVALIACGCCCCMSCQSHRELHLHGDYPGGCCTEENPKYAAARPHPAMGYPGQNSVPSSAIPSSVYPHQQGPPYGAPPPLQTYPYSNQQYMNSNHQLPQGYHGSPTAQPYIPYVPDGNSVYTAQSSTNNREDDEEERPRLSSVYPQYDEDGNPKKPSKKPRNRPQQQQQQQQLPMAYPVGHQQQQPAYYNDPSPQYSAANNNSGRYI